MPGPVPAGRPRAAPGAARRRPRHRRRRLPGRRGRARRRPSPAAHRRARPASTPALPSAWTPASAPRCAAATASHDGPLVLSAQPPGAPQGHGRAHRGRRAARADRHDGLQIAIGGSGRDRPRLERLARSTGAPVHLPRPRSRGRPPAVYGAADVFAMLCRNRWGGLEQEGFGIVFLEAAACGVPQVAGAAGARPRPWSTARPGWWSTTPPTSVPWPRRIDRLLDDADPAAAHGRGRPRPRHRRVRLRPSGRPSRRRHRGHVTDEPPLHPIPRSRRPAERRRRRRHDRSEDETLGAARQRQLRRHRRRRGRRRGRCTGPRPVRAR